MRTLLALLLTCIMVSSSIAAVIVLPGCNPAATQQALAAGGAGLALAQCSDAVYDADNAAGVSPAQIAADELKSCQGPADALASAVDAHEAAAVAQGLAVAGDVAGVVSSLLRSSADAGAGG